MFPAIYPFNALTKNAGGWQCGLMVGKTLQNANSIEQTNIQRERNDAYVRLSIGKYMQYRTQQCTNIYIQNDIKIYSQDNNSIYMILRASERASNRERFSRVGELDDSDRKKKCDMGFSMDLYSTRMDR